MKRIVAIALLAGTVMAADVPRAPAPDAVVLLQSYYRFTFVKEVQRGAQTLAEGRREDVRGQVDRVVSRWVAGEKESIRASLQESFGARAKEVFAFFVGRYTEAEQKGDGAYLNALNAQLGLKPAPASYAALRQYASDAWQKERIAALGAMMGNIQTWVGLAEADRKAPTLETWLARDTPAAPAARPAKVSPLAAAEPAMPDFSSDATSGAVNVLDAYGARRAERRESAAAEAQAAMKQVAEERRAAEEAEASARSAAAQREAEAVKAYAQKLADTEKEAMEQRQNTWSARFKRLGVAVITGGATAVTSGIGAGAGAAVAETIFD